MFAKYNDNSFFDRLHNSNPYIFFHFEDNALSVFFAEQKTTFPLFLTRNVDDHG